MGSDAIPAAVAPSLDTASIKSKTVVKAFDLPVISDTYNSLVKFTSPLSPVVEKIGSMASPALDQVLGLRADIEAKVPDVVSKGLDSAFAQVTSAAVSLDAKLSSASTTWLRRCPP